MILQKTLMLLVIAGVAGVKVVRSIGKAASAAPVAAGRTGGARWWSSFHLGWPEVSAAALVIILITDHT
jgi:hypothetical protein